MPQSRNNPVREAADEAYTEILNECGGRINDLQAVRNRTKEKLEDSAIESLLDAAVIGAVRDVDEARTHPSTGAGAQLAFEGPGWPDPTDLVWPLGDGQRVRVKEATADDHRIHLTLIEANARNIEDRRRAAADGYYRLAPYYAAGHGTVESAATAYQHDTFPPLDDRNVRNKA